MKSHRPESETNAPSPRESGGTDFASLTGRTDPDLVAQQSVIEQQREKQKPDDPTDFESLEKGWERIPKRLQRRTATDWLVEGVTPTLIFLMVWSVLFFLLDVRYVCAEANNETWLDTNDLALRFAVFGFILGIVALNRLVARDGKDESVIYILGLGVAVVFYTVATTSGYGVGSVAQGFLNAPGVALAFNLALVGFIWWLVNRLTHECCVDEDITAGDVGILTSTARRFRQAVEKGRTAGAPKHEPSLRPVDPSQWTGAPKKQSSLAPPPAATQRLPKRPAGVSVLYFSVPVMIAFTAGIRVLGHKPQMMVMGFTYVVVYTVSALLLLMCSSLAQVRAYFRARRVRIPGGLGVFWVGLGTFMVTAVIFGAAALPNPDLPPLSKVGSPFKGIMHIAEKPKTFGLPGMEYMPESSAVVWIGRGVLVALALFLLYAAARGAGAGAFALAKRHAVLPLFVRRFLLWLDRLLQRITHLPQLPRLRPRPKVSRDVALSAEYANPLSTPGMSMPDQVAYAYDALCALALDLGVPRRPDQTPYEFMHSFPKELEHLRDEAEELTDFYVTSTYSSCAISDEAITRLRRFWKNYTQTRNAVLR